LTSLRRSDAIKIRCFRNSNALFEFEQESRREKGRGKKKRENNTIQEKGKKTHHPTTTSSLHQ